MSVDATDVKSITGAVVSFVDSTATLNSNDPGSVRGWVSSALDLSTSIAGAINSNPVVKGAATALGGVAALASLNADLDAYQQAVTEQ